MNLLLEIDPDVRAEAEGRARRGQWKGSMGAQEENLLSRVDLITRAVVVLRRVHSENEQRKQIIGGVTGNGIGGRQGGALDEEVRMQRGRVSMDREGCGKYLLVSTRVHTHMRRVLRTDINSRLVSRIDIF
jgi:hypothetical protein